MSRQLAETGASHFGVMEAQVMIPLCNQLHGLSSRYRIDLRTARLAPS